jgi:hypothetical protein
MKLVKNVFQVAGFLVFLGGLLAAVGVSGALLDWNLPGVVDAAWVVGLLVVGHYLVQGLGALNVRSLVTNLVLHVVAAVGVVVVVAGLAGGVDVAHAFATHSVPVLASLQALVLVVVGGFVACWAHDRAS